MKMTEKDSSFKENTPKESTHVETGDLNYGYDFFPERRGAEQKKGFWSYLAANRSQGRKLRCHSNVHWCFRNSEYRLCNSVILCGALILDLIISRDYRPL